MFSHSVAHGRSNCKNQARSKAAAVVRRSWSVIVQSSSLVKDCPVSCYVSGLVVSGLWGVKFTLLTELRSCRHRHSLRDAVNAQAVVHSQDDGVRASRRVHVRRVRLAAGRAIAEEPGMLAGVARAGELD